MDNSFENNAPSSRVPPLWQRAYEQYGLENNLDVLNGKDNLLDLLQPKIDQHSSAIAFSMGAATLNFAQLDVASRRFAAFLQAQNIQRATVLRCNCQIYCNMRWCCLVVCAQG